MQTIVARFVNQREVSAICRITLCSYIIFAALLPGSSVKAELIISDFDGYLTPESVALEGRTLAIGQIPINRQTDFNGSVNLYDVATGARFDEIIAPETTDVESFGHSVAMSNSRVLVGSPSPFSRFQANSPGSAYVFDASLQMTQRLVPIDGETADRFGDDVDIDGSVAIVGSSANNRRVAGEQFLESVGSVYLFDIDSGLQLRKISNPEPQEFDGFGYSVAISGERIIVGTRRDDGPGAAYLYDHTTGDMIARLQVEDQAGNVYTNYQVDIHGDIAIVSAGYEVQDGLTISGRATLFDARDGSKISDLIPESETAIGFGADVAIDGQTAVVGAQFEMTAGAAYFFDLNTFEQISRVTPSDELGPYLFGSSVAIDDRNAVVGNNNGKVYLYQNLISQIIIGDFDDDGQIAQGDLNLVLNNWGDIRGDWANASGFATSAVDQEELNAVLNNWGSQVSPSFDGRNLPEPAAAIVVALFILARGQRLIARPG
ncbi:MAG: hypothetical protein AAGH92_07990 [Planctomycetota bacterium]